MTLIQVTGDYYGTVSGTNQADEMIISLSMGTQIYGGNGGDSITLLGSTYTTTDAGNGQDAVYLVGGGFNVVGGANGTDMLEALLSLGPVQLNGGNGADFIGGSAFADGLSGGNGDDVLFGRAGSDTISGDRGDDAITGGLGNDSLLGGTGSDSFFYNFAAISSTAAGIDGRDTIGDFNVHQDHLILHDILGATDTNHVLLSTVGGDTVITFDQFVGTDQTITLLGVTGFADLQAAMDAGWLLFA